jgi:polyadenylate-binding protein
MEGNKTLYVGNLKPGISNTQLYEFFTGHNFSVVHAKVKISNKNISNVFGAVKFSSEAEAQKALDSLNNSELEGCKLRLMWWSPGSPVKDRENANIYVKDLDNSITQKDLSEKFSAFGKILSVKLETFSDGSSKGFGYVQFEEQKAASQAIEETNNTEWNGKTITVCEFKPRTEREEHKSFKNNLYCRNFPSDYTEDDLKKLFEKHGKITSLLVKPHEDGKKQAFICFETGEQAQQAVRELDGTTVEGSDDPLLVNELLNKHERREENLKNFKKIKEKNLYKSLAQNLYVNGIPKDKTEDEIRQEFEKFGPVSSIKMHMMPSRDDSTKKEFVGAAFVCYEDAEDAKNAVYRGNMEPMFGTSIFIDYYKPKEVKKKEKVEEAGVTMKQMIHSFMMTALSQTNNRGGARGRGHRGGRGRGGQNSYSGYGAPAMPGHGYGSGAPSGMNYGQPPVAPANRGYSGASQYNPPLPGSTGSSSVLPPGPPPVSGPPPAGLPKTGPLPAGSAPVAGDESIVSKTEVASMTDEDRKNHIGEKIYPIIEEKYGENAPRITGMIIDMDPSDLMPALESRKALEKLAAEGYNLLMENPGE